MTTGGRCVTPWCPSKKPSRCRDHRAPFQRLAANERVRQVLGYRGIADVLAVHRQVAAGATVIALSRSLNSGSAGTIDQLQFDIGTDADDLPSREMAGVASIRSIA